MHGWLMQGNLRRFLHLLHTLVEERAGERRLSTISAAPCISQQ